MPRRNQIAGMRRATVAACGGGHHHHPRLRPQHHAACGINGHRNGGERGRDPVFQAVHGVQGGLPPQAQRASNSSTNSRVGSPGGGPAGLAGRPSDKTRADPVKQLICQRIPSNGCGALLIQKTVGSA